ncbi:MAG: hypothetical protein ACYDHA_06225, partial [Bellilinea sp.]
RKQFQGSLQKSLSFLIAQLAHHRSSPITSKLTDYSLSIKPNSGFVNRGIDLKRRIMDDPTSDSGITID